eukprot:363060-Chlamydomonas_euryale.AAC.10
MHAAATATATTVPPAAPTDTGNQKQGTAALQRAGLFLSGTSYLSRGDAPPPTPPLLPPDAPALPPAAQHTPAKVMRRR